jgi:predicted small secreted protein
LLEEMPHCKEGVLTSAYGINIISSALKTRPRGVHVVQQGSRVMPVFETMITPLIPGDNVLSIVTIPLSIILSCVFFASALPKLRHPKGFILVVLEYRVLPPELGLLYARLLPPLEFLLALLLVTGTAIRAAGVVAALLLFSFLVAASINLARGRRLDCHCFGHAMQRQIGWGLLVQDGVLLAFTIVLIALDQPWLILERWSVFRLVGLSGVGGLGWLVGCLGVTACAAILLRNFGKSVHRERKQAARLPR